VGQANGGSVETGRKFPCYKKGIFASRDREQVCERRNSEHRSQRIRNLELGSFGKFLKLPEETAGAGEGGGGRTFLLRDRRGIDGRNSIWRGAGTSTPEGKKENAATTWQAGPNSQLGKGRVYWISRGVRLYREIKKQLR